MSYTWAKNSLPDPLRRRLRVARQIGGKAGTHPGFAVSTMPLLGELIAAAAPPKGPPVLVASLPRGGSSWIGRILGSSDDSLYLREPVTQTYLEHMDRRQSPFFEWDMCMDPRIYRRLAARAFRGIPRFEAGIVPFPEQWALGSRSSKRIVVKEVNPLAARWLWERYRPKIVLLVRHPVPVSRSFGSLGWTTRDQFTTRFLPENLARFGAMAPLPRSGSIWEQGGAFQAIVQNLVAESLAGIDHVVARYEDVCRNPIAEFERIFAFCELPFSPTVRAEIERSSRKQGDYVPGQFDTARNSSAMSDRWKTEVEPENIERVRASYLAYDPVFYTSEEDWQTR